MKQKKVWIDSEDRIPLMGKDELEKRIRKAQMRDRIIQVSKVIIYLAILIIMIETILPFPKTISYIANSNNAISANYLASFNALNTSTAYNGMLIAKTVSLSQQSITGLLSLVTFAFSMVIVIGSITYLFWMMPRYLNVSGRLEYELEAQLLGTRRIARVCKFCIKGENHNGLIHEIDLMKSDYIGKRYWVKVEDVK